MLLIHLLLNSGSVECTSRDFSCVYSETIFTIISVFQKLIKGVGIRAGGWKIFQKLISGGGDDYSVLESTPKRHALSLNSRCGAAMNPISPICKFFNRRAFNLEFGT